MKRRRITERRLVDVLISYFRVKHDSVAREVPHYEKRIDVVFFDSGNDELYAIEAKTESWARALSQALVNLGAADRSYIAIYSKNAHRVSLKSLEAHGIGLLSVGTKWGDVKLMLEAQPSAYVNRLAADRIRKSIGKKENGNGDSSSLRNAP